MNINAWHEDDSRNSYAWGLRLAPAIEYAIAAISQVRTLTAAEACAIADAIIEIGANDDAYLDGSALTDGATDGSPLYRAALIAQRVAA